VTKQDRSEDGEGEEEDGADAGGGVQTGREGRAGGVKQFCGGSIRQAIGCGDRSGYVLVRGPGRAGGDIRGDDCCQSLNASKPSPRAFEGGDPTREIHAVSLAS
jgi:hypothetical protein